MRVIKLDSKVDEDLILGKIGATSAGNAILKDKMKINIFFIKNIKSVAANILKQDALSIGADLVVPKNTILLKDEKVDALLLVNDKQLKILSHKEKQQAFGLKNMALQLQQHHGLKSYPTSIMGIFNINEDSFHKDSRLKVNDAQERILKMIEDAADIIDIGGVSSRPGSEKVSVKEELQRVKPVIDLIYKKELHTHCQFSIDSYEPEVIEYALDHGFSIVNDITGLQNDKIAKLCSKYSAKVIIMHMQGNPKTMQRDPKYENILVDIEDFFKARVEKAQKYGIKNIILDVGIGFGKTLEHNLQLIKHLSHFKKFNIPLLIGASRKSIINEIIPSSIEKRLPATLALHLKALEQGASIVRCHDVKEHKMALEVFKALHDTTI